MARRMKLRRARILVVFGTRPEAIKIFPLLHVLAADAGVELRCCVTGQHRDMLDQVLAISGIVPDIDLNVMAAGQTLDGLTARLLTELGAVMDTEKPDRVVVQGDTATAMVGALTAYYRKIPVSHVEAGLRSYNIYHPWPEEVNRKIIGSIADQHFAPTETAAAALRRENVANSMIYVTGNTVIDALYATKARIDADPSLAAGLDDLAVIIGDRRIVAVTTHRRENFGDGIAGIARAVLRLVDRPDVVAVFPVHPNPNVRGPMLDLLGGRDDIFMIDPLDYPHFVRLLSMAHMLLTDSGGVQEEAPAFGKPVLVMRDTTERPEGIEAGTAKLVGTDENRIVAEAGTLLDDPEAYAAMARARNPFGDGHASARIAKVIINGF